MHIIQDFQGMVYRPKAARHQGGFTVLFFCRTLLASMVAENCRPHVSALADTCGSWPIRATQWLKGADHGPTTLAYRPTHAVQWPKRAAQWPTHAVQWPKEADHVSTAADHDITGRQQRHIGRRDGGLTGRQLHFHGQTIVQK